MYKRLALLFAGLLACTSDDKSDGSQPASPETLAELEAYEARRAEEEAKRAAVIAAAAAADTWRQCADIVLESEGLVSLSEQCGGRDDDRWFKSRWKTVGSRDELTGKPITTRKAQSKSTIRLSFPYDGPQRAELHLREHPRFGTDVILRVREGQFTCRYSGCRLEVAFDDEDPSKWRAVEPADNSSNMLFLRRAERFIRKAERAEEIRIAATFHRDGQRVLVFPGLKEN